MNRGTALCFGFSQKGSCDEMTRGSRLEMARGTGNGKGEGKGKGRGLEGGKGCIYIRVQCSSPTNIHTYIHTDSSL